MCACIFVTHVAKFHIIQHPKKNTSLLLFDGTGVKKKNTKGKRNTFFFFFFEYYTIYCRRQKKWALSIKVLLSYQNNELLLYNYVVKKFKVMLKLKFLSLMVKNLNFILCM
jgi:hypothetical protein